MNPGAIVSCRNREWVLMPSDDPGVHILRPLAGTPDEAVALHKSLSEIADYCLPDERIRPAIFPLPRQRRVSSIPAKRRLHGCRRTRRCACWPTRGATRRRSWFQSTRPRGARLWTRAL